MANPGRTVFLSYRREVSWAMAHLVRNDLMQHGFDVFMDIHGIDSGEFERVILREIETREHFLVLVEPRSFDRIGDPGDWLRREIACALTDGRNVVPVLANGARPPRAVDLPPDVARLASFNAVSVPHDYFPEAMQKLRDRFLQSPPGQPNADGPAVPAPTADHPDVPRRIRAARAAGSLVGRLEGRLAAALLPAPADHVGTPELVPPGTIAFDDTVTTDRFPAVPPARLPLGRPLGSDATPPAELVAPATADRIRDLDDEVLVADGLPRFHLAGCPALAGETLAQRPVVPLPVREVVRLGFTPCAWCAPHRTLISHLDRSPEAGSSDRW